MTLKELLAQFSCRDVSPTAQHTSAQQVLADHQHRIDVGVQLQVSADHAPYWCWPRAAGVGGPGAVLNWCQVSYMNVRVWTRKLWDGELEQVHTRRCGWLRGPSAFPLPCVSSPAKSYPHNHLGGPFLPKLKTPETPQQKEVLCKRKTLCLMSQRCWYCLPTDL